MSARGKDIETIMNNYYNEDCQAYLVKSGDFDPLEILEFFLPAYMDVNLIYRMTPFYCEETDYEVMPQGWFCSILVILPDERYEDQVEIHEFQVVYATDFDFYENEQLRLLICFL